MRCTFFLLLFFIAMAGNSCHKSVIPRGKLTGKLVIAGPCGQYTIQLLSGNIDPSLLTKSWLNTANDSTYTNVFASLNPCQMESAGISQGDSFNFDLSANGPGSCYECMLYYPVPPTHSAIKNITKLQ